MSTNKHITMIGATGNLGAPVVKNLARLGYTIKVIARNTQKAQTLFGHLPEVEIVYGDLSNASSLKSALEETSVLYLNLSTNTVDRNLRFSTEREGVANILQAIDHQSIQQIIVISGLGAFDNYHAPGAFEFIPNIIRKQGHMLIKNSGIPYTILHCTSFIDNFMLYRRNGSYSVIGNPEFPVYFTNCYDYSVQLANAIGNSDAMYKEFPIQGETGIAHLEAAQRFFSVYAPETKVKVLPKGIINFMSKFNKELKFVKHMADYFSLEPEEFLAEEHLTYKVLGRPGLGLEDYALKLKEEQFYAYLP